MNTVLKAYTLSECMEVMAEKAAQFEAAGGKNLIFCEDRLSGQFYGVWAAVSIPPFPPFRGF